jgi:hypothetical protein
VLFSRLLHLLQILRANLVTQAPGAAVNSNDHFPLLEAEALGSLGIVDLVNNLDFEVVVT